jgi:hypothetical protein
MVTIRYEKYDNQTISTSTSVFKSYRVKAQKYPLQEKDNLFGYNICNN